MFSADASILALAAADAPDDSHAARLSSSAMRRRRRQLAKRFAGAAQAAHFRSHNDDGHRSVGLAALGDGGTGEAPDSPRMQRCEQWRVQLEAGEDVQSVADAVRGSVLDFSWNRLGCRVVQLLLTLLTTRGAAPLVEELHGHVVDAVQSPHANFVIQRVIELMPPSMSAFVAEELVGHGGWAARHCYGCRIICRLVEHGATSEGTMILVDEVLSSSHELCFHMFGHYVVQVVLEHGAPRHRHAILSALCRETLRKAVHRNGSHVMEKALAHAAGEDRAALQHELLRNVAPLAEGPFGCFVLRALLRDRGVAPQAVAGQLQPHARWLGSTRHGRALLNDAGLGCTAE